MKRPTKIFLRLIVSIVLSACVPECRAQKWVRLGPEGGQVISLAVGEKGETFLGTADGHVFASADEGRSWTLSGHLSERWDAVVQAMVADTANPKRIFAGVWYQDPAAGGGVFWSEDGGATWRRRGLEGEAVRALVQWSHDPNVLVAGTKTGVFRTTDAGVTWERISPQGDAELRNLDSIAIDPRDANVIYAGTFHLPWKTMDGGKHWTAIAEGMIDDSDIMSIAIDATTPERVFASACSGIYRSESGGMHWTKLEGIPYASRRTQQILQDPAHSARWFAGTTEGLWETGDGGETWERVLSRETSVNALVFAKQTDALILGTDEGVRVESKDRGKFPASDQGFGHRVLSASAAQGQDGKRLLVAIDGAEAEILQSTDGGAIWKAMAKPKKPAVRLFSLQDRWIAGLRGGGAAVFDNATGRWKGWRFVQRTSAPAAKTNPSNRKVPREIAVLPEVRAVTAAGGRVFVAAESGLWTGSAREGVFRKVALAERQELFLDVVAQGGELLAVAGTALWESEDGGTKWTHLPLPTGADALLWARFIPSAPERVLLGTEKGVFLAEFGATGNGLPAWRLLQSGLPATASGNGWIGNGTWAISSRAGAVYVSRDQGANWERLEEGTPGAARAVVGMTSDGILVETQADGLMEFSFGSGAAHDSRNGTRGDANLVKHE